MSYNHRIRAFLVFPGVYIRPAAPRPYKARPGILRRYPNGSLRFEDGRTRSRIFESLGADGGWFMVRNVATEVTVEEG